MENKEQPKMITPEQLKTIKGTLKARGVSEIWVIDNMTRAVASNLIAALFSHNDDGSQKILDTLPLLDNPNTTTTTTTVTAKVTPPEPKETNVSVTPPNTETTTESTKKMLETLKVTPVFGSTTHHEINPTSEASYFSSLESHLEQAVKMVQLFQAAKAKVLAASDIVEIKGRQFVKRSGWRKIGLLFGVQWQIVSIEREGTEKGHRQVRVIVRSSLPYGRYVDEVAVNNSEEYTGNRSGQDTWHNLEATATSRAINRAISDLIGAGEVSAEEITGDV